MRRAAAFAVLLLLLVAGACTELERGEAKLRVGSKGFTESVILGEILAATARSQGCEAEHRDQLGGTRVLFNALVGGEIDCYPEYSGTLLHEIFAEDALNDRSELDAALKEKGLILGPAFGFNNTYALGVTRETASRYGLERISDLVRHPELALGFSNEFMDRSDGWPGLRAHYGLPQADVQGLDHDLAYRGLEAGSIQVMDLYSTDAEIRYYDLVILADDRAYFPRYDALLLCRADLPGRLPRLWEALQGLDGAIDEDAMVAMNAAVKIERESEAAVASRFVGSLYGDQPAWSERSRLQRVLVRSGEHLALVGISLLAALLVALPLGIAAAKLRIIEQPLLALVGIVQTIPSLALLVFMIPLLGIGAPPAIAALFLYSLLPIVRNTHAGLRDIPLPIRESAEALGLSPAARLRRVELPLALSGILAGVKTSAVINIGTATLAALIGAGGYGQPILTGIRLDDIGLILEGAVPAALLAILAQLLFEGVERLLVPRGLRLQPE